jgi:DNA-binding GntR family transcriptional regulator
VRNRTTDLTQIASAPEVIFEALWGAITKGDLAEGEPLRQDRIAKLSNVSRVRRCVRR